MWPRVTIDDVGVRREIGAARATSGMSSTTIFVGGREALGVGELLAVVDDVDAEADLVRAMRARWKPTWPAPTM